jgi:hypothetical protein
MKRLLENSLKKEILLEKQVKRISCEENSITLVREINSSYPRTGVINIKNT